MRLNGLMLLDISHTLLEVCDKNPTIQYIIVCTKDEKIFCARHDSRLKFGIINLVIEEFV